MRAVREKEEKKKKNCDQEYNVKNGDGLIEIGNIGVQLSPSMLTVTTPWIILGCRICVVKVICGGLKG